MVTTKAAYHDFSLFRGGIKVKAPSQAISIEACIDLIKSSTYAKATQELRSLDKELQKDCKAKFDYVTFSGTFAPTRSAKNLQQHSGLICLDFDNVNHLPETYVQLQADPHTLASFISPSGTGIKLIVAIDQLADKTDQGWTARHKGAFKQLSLYFHTNYGIDVDSSGSDESRACFLPHDPNAYINLEADVYKVYDTISNSQTVSLLNGGYSLDSTDTHAYVLSVVERIELARIDISGGPGGYNNRLLLAFCMSSLGEAGRALLHRVLSFYVNYDAKETDAKFDQGIQTCRFTSPWKFFTLAKECGIDVSLPKKLSSNTISNVPAYSKAANTAIEPKAITEEKAKLGRAAEFSHQVVYHEVEHRISIGSKRGFCTVADNFLLLIKYITEDEYENLTWILEIKPKDREPLYIEVPHDDFTSASRLKRIITGKQYSLQITDVELSVLQAYLFRETKFQRVIKITRYGYHAPSGVFFFANYAVFPGLPLLEPDALGMVKVTTADQKDMVLSVPRQNRHKKNRFTLTNASVSVDQFFQVFAQVHLYENAIIPFCHYLMALFRDVAIRHKNFSPIIYLKGGSGTGKTSLIRVLTSCFGKRQEGVNLKSKNTESALVKIMSQASNTLTWMDEFHNDLGSTEGLLQAAYDNDGYHRSRDSTSSETDAIEIYSALALTSNYIPDNPIFFSRCVFIPITSQEKTAEQSEAYDRLRAMEDDGLGSVTVELLQHRSIVEKEYASTFELLHKGLKVEFRTEKIPERFFANMAQTMTVCLILASAGKIHVTETTDKSDILNELIQIGAANIRRQHRITAERTALTEFVEIIQSLYDQYQIHEEVHFSFRKVGTDYKIRLWFPQLYNLYAQTYRRMFQKAPADKDTLQSEMATLEGFTDWEEMSKGIRFRNDGENSSSSKTIPRSGSCEMDYKKLSTLYGLNLELRKAKI